MNMKTISTASLVVLAIGATACQTTRGAQLKQAAGARTELHVVSRGDTSQKLAPWVTLTEKSDQVRPARTGSPVMEVLIENVTYRLKVDGSYSKAKEVAINDACLAREATAQGLPLAALAFLVEPAVKFVLGTIEDSLKDYLKEHTASYGAGGSGELYQRIVMAAGRGDTEGRAVTAASSFDLEEAASQGSSALGQLEQSAICIRLMRYTDLELGGDDGKGEKNKQTARTIWTDLIVQLQMDELRQSLRVRPLRIYFAKPTARGGELGISAKIKIDAVWMNKASSGKTDLLSQRLLAKKFSTEEVETEGRNEIFTKKPFVYFFDLDNGRIKDDWVRYRFHPLVPVSTDERGRPYGTGPFNVTIEVAEAGKKPKIIEALVDGFSDARGDLEDLIIDAANAAIAGDDES